MHRPPLLNALIFWLRRKMDTSKAESPTVNSDPPPAPKKSYTYQDNFYTPSNSEFYESNPYSDLDQSKHEIRLLELRLVQHGRPIEVSFRTISLDLLETEKENNFTAISYAAGSYEETETMYVNGIRFNAFANLARALRQAAQAMEKEELQGYPRLIWTDQICINQSNVEERSHQVGFMRNIYQAATVVLACLGDDPTNGRCMEVIDRMKYWSNPTVDSGDTTIRVNGYAVANLNDGQFQEDWTMLYGLFSCPWWRRGWVYQEVVVAREVILLFGNFAIHWDILSRILGTIITLSLSFIEHGITKNGVPTEWGIDEDRDHGHAYRMNLARMERDNKINILSLLSEALAFESSDMRDRVFAFVSLADPAYDIVPDYTISPEALLILTCKKIILHERKLNILVHCQKMFDEKKISGIPSWVPDWLTFAPFSHCIGLIYPSWILPHPFRASRELPTTATFVENHGFGDSILRVQCLFIDSVATWKSLGSRDGTNPPPMEVWAHNVAPIDDEKSYRYLDRSSKTLDEAFDSVIHRGRKDHMTFSPLQSEGESEYTRIFAQCFRSPKGYLGVAKKSAGLRHTDQICVLIGADFPFILRKVEEHFTLISDAYVEGLMYGEAIDLMEQGKLELVTIDIH